MTTQEGEFCSPSWVILKEGNFMKPSFILNNLLKIIVFMLAIIPKISVADDGVRIIQLYKETPKQVNLSFAKEIPIYIPNVLTLPILDIQKIPVDSNEILDSEKIVKNYPGYFVVENQSSFDDEYPVNKRRFVIDDVFLNVWNETNLNVYASNQNNSANDVYNFLKNRISELYDIKYSDTLPEKISVLSPFQDYIIDKGEPVNIRNSKVGQLTGVGGYKLSAIETLRNIPLLCGISWAYALTDNTHAADGIPFELLCESRFMLFYYSNQYYNIKCYSIYQEVGERLEDIPLCPFEKIVESIEQQYSKGIIDRVYSIKLGYVVFSDPNCIDYHNREDARKYVYVAVPSWVVECNLSEYRCELDNDSDTDYTTNIGYYRMIINAQTGEVYNRYSKSEERYTMPKIKY